MCNQQATYFIKLSRKLLDWEWYKIPEMTRLWIHLLLTANWKDKEWRGMTICRGQLISSLSNLASETGLSVSQIRTCLRRMVNSKQINIEIANQLTKITICNYDGYQGCGETQSQAINTGNDTLDSNEIAMTKEIKNNKKKNISKDISEKESIIERLYAKYPTKCPVSGRATGKSSKDKQKLATLLSKHTEEELTEIINRYIADCVSTKTYIKNFSTFLNNLPDYSESPHAEQKIPVTPVIPEIWDIFEAGHRKKNRIPQNA